ncbi:MAG: cytochrome bc complex cytochrome b subunit [Thermodesulfovibrionales bacterium]
MLEGARKWLEVRVGWEELKRTQLTGYKVPADINFFYTLGFVALFGFVLQALTGFLLLIYYVPHPDYAFESVRRITEDVPFGWLVRLSHVTGSNLVVAVVLLHMASVFVMGSYRKPRELTWTVGALMLLLALTFCLSGYLLPWSQLSYWATTIVTNLPTAFPYVGTWFAGLLKGGEAVSGATLGRFFALHVAILPTLLVALVSVHIFLVRRIGISSPPSPGRQEPEWTEFRHESHPEGRPFYPDFFMRELYMVMFYMALMFFVVAFAPGLFLPHEANAPADPLRTPEHIKPEWYFLAAYQMLRLIPSKFLGVALQVAAVAAFVLLPFLDTGRERDIRKRPFALAGFLVVTALLVALSIWGKYS